MAVDILILAAGASRRFGGCKLLAEWRGAPLLTYALNTAVGLSQKPEYRGYIASVNLVLGAYESEIRDFLKTVPRTDYQTLSCPDWSLGLGHSLSYGISQLPTENSVLVMLADQPLVSTGDIQQLIEASLMNSDKIICAEFSSTLGVPALFPAGFKKYLKQLKGDRGAKTILAEKEGSLIKIALYKAAFDADLPGDFL